MSGVLAHAVAFRAKLFTSLNRAHCGLRCLSHQKRQRRQQLWQTLHTEPKQLTIQGSKLRQLSRRRCDAKVKIEISFAYSLKLISNIRPMFRCVYRRLMRFCAPHCLNTRDSHFLHSYSLSMLSKDMFTKWRVTARQHEVIDAKQSTEHE